MSDMKARCEDIHTHTHTHIYSLLHEQNSSYLLISFIPTVHYPTKQIQIVKFIYLLIEIMGSTDFRL